MSDNVTEERLSEEALAIWQAGVDAVRTDRLVAERVSMDGDFLSIEAHSGNRTNVDLAQVERVCIVGAGKAAAGMTVALEQQFDRYFGRDGQVTGWVNVPNGTARPTKHVTLHECRPLGRNEPTVAAMDGTRAMLEMAGSLENHDLCVVVLTGGASALTPMPVDGVSLEDKITVTRFLSAAGADIRQINAVRRNLSRFKGGQLAESCGAGRIVTLILSDVINDPLESIGSGPTVRADDRQLARSTLVNLDPTRQYVPTSIWRALDGEPALTGHEPRQAVVNNIVLGNNQTSVNAAANEATRRGYVVEVEPLLTDQPTANELGVGLAACYRRLSRLPGKRAVISGGEPTVRLAPAASRGAGGRNQQAVLAALVELAQSIERDPVAPDIAAHVCLLSGGTDGEDGPTDAAGAIAGPTEIAQVHNSLAQANEALATNNAYVMLDRLGALLRTGQTGTNVCDLRVVLKQ